MALPENFSITAHSGCEGTIQNSLESVIAGIKYGANVVEIDLQFTSDGIPVLSHNAPKGGEPTLQDCFAILKKHPSVKMNIDVKTTTNMPEVQRLAIEYNVLSQVFFTGVFSEMVEPVRKGSPLISYYLNVKPPLLKKHFASYWAEVIDEINSLGAVGINIKYTRIPKKFVPLFKKANLLVSLWTVDDEEKMKYLLTYEPNNITTKKPTLLQKVLQK